MMFDQKTMLDRYYQLVDRRDAVNATNAPLELQLDAANLEVQEAQARALALAAQIDANRGGIEWLDLKKEIGVLARALVRIPPRG